jgi:glycosyltransferase involved in cell wall biosynthesis
MMTWDSPVGAVFQLDQAKGLSKIGYRVAILSPAPATMFAYLKNFFSSKVSTQIVVDEMVENVQILRTEKNFILPARYFERAYAKTFVKDGMILWRNYISKAGTPDVVHLHNAWCAGLLAFALRELGYKGKIVLTEHDSIAVAVVPSSFKHEQLKAVYNACNVILTVSNYLKRKVVDDYGLDHRKIRVVANCIDDTFLKVESDCERRQSNQLCLVTVGNLIPIKAHAILIEAFEIAYQKNNNIYLEIIGAGPLAKQLALQVRQLSCRDHIQLLGYKNRIQIAERFKESNLFILPSQRETFGVVLIEAMCFGLPCIAFKGSGPDDIITPENGILVDSQDANSLAQAILSMANNLQQYDSDRIIQETKRKYSDVHIAEQLQEIYQL